MKNTKKFLFGFLVAVLGLTVQANAEVKPTLKHEAAKSQVRQLPVQSKARLTGYANEAVVNGTYVYGTSYIAKYKKISNNEYSWAVQTDSYGSYQASYYKKINNRWVNYKLQVLTKYADKSSYYETYNYALTSSCPVGSATNGTALNCVVKYGSTPVYANAAVTRKNKNNQSTYYYYRTYATNKPTSYYPTYEDWRSYYTNGKTSARDLTWFNASGKQTKSQEYYYDTRGRLKQRAYYNAKNNRTSLLLYTYYANNRVKAKYTATYNPNIRNRHKAGIYMKYRSNGKKYYYKRMYYKTNGKKYKMVTITYNKKGQKKSNRYGNSYRYVTTIRANGHTISKVYRAKYSAKGKLSKAKKVKVTATSRTYYEY